MKKPGICTRTIKRSIGSTAETRPKRQDSNNQGKQLLFFYPNSRGMSHSIFM